MRDADLSACCIAACSMSARLVLQIPPFQRRRLGHSSEKRNRNDEILSCPGQGHGILHRILDVVGDVDACASYASRRTSTRSVPFIANLECGSQIADPTALFLDLGLQLPMLFGLS